MKSGIVFRNTLTLGNGFFMLHDESCQFFNFSKCSVFCSKLGDMRFDDLTNIKNIVNRVLLIKENGRQRLHEGFFARCQYIGAVTLPALNEFRRFEGTNGLSYRGTRHSERLT